MTNNIANYLKFASVQMAAEADYKGVTDFSNRDAIKAALIRGNNRSSRFTDITAKDFSDNWTVVDQKPNTSTGFSGTLFKYTGPTDAAKGLINGELVMSFRSTEFADDAARDNEATNKLEIKDHGWAFGQIADMQDWYASLKSSGKIAGGQQIAVTGYSLGGHLATAFDLLHKNDLTSSGAPLVSATYTFNGAGVGAVNAGKNLGQVIADFQSHRAYDSNEGLFTDAQVKVLYNTLRQTFRKGALVTLDQVDSFLPQVQTMVTSKLGTAKSEAVLLFQALDSIQKIVNEAQRVVGLQSGGTGAGATVVNTSNIEACALDYQLAVLVAARDTTPMYASVPAGGWAAYAGRHLAPGGTLPHFYDLYGANDPSAVANSQLHYGTAVGIAIEDQPLFRGTVALDALVESARNAEAKLLVNNFTQNDFGDTHSLVLLVDSLSVQNALAQLDPALSQGTVNTIWKIASSQKAESSLLGGQGRAEGDVLENIVNSLGAALGLNTQAGWTPLKGDTTGGTWARTEGGANGSTGRTALHSDLNLIARSALALVGKAQVRASGADLGAMARSDFGALIALKDLSPLYITDKDASIEAPLAALWQGTRAADYTAWQADQIATPGTLTFTDPWITDRSSMLNALLQRNSGNIADGLLLQGQSNTDYVDMAIGKNLFVRRGVPGSGTVVNKVIFDGAGAGSLGGGTGADHLYGGAGNDTLEGKGGNDYEEGGVGFDTYRFSAAGWGHDVVVDADGAGCIQLGAVILASCRPWPGSSSVWLDSSKTYLLTLVQGAGGTNDLVIARKDSPGAATLSVRNWSETRSLGITLDMAPVPDRPAVTRVGWPTDSAHDFRPLGSSGNDSLTTTGYGKSFDGGAGDDAMTIFGNANLLVGGAGGDELMTIDGSYNTLDGGDGDDLLTDDGSGSTLTGGAGNDTLISRHARSTIVYNPGDGQDRVIAGADATLDFRDINSANVRLGRGAGKEAGPGTGLAAGLDLVLTMGGSDQVTVQDYFRWMLPEEVFPPRPVLKFADGVLTPQAVVDRLNQGGSGDDTLWGIEDPSGLDDLSTHLLGEGGNDTLTAAGAHDVLEGGAGNDVLFAGSGADTFVFNRGDGQDVLYESEFKMGGNHDVLQLGAGISVAGTQLVRTTIDASSQPALSDTGPVQVIGEGDLALVFGGGDQIILKKYFYSLSRLQTIAFADGTRWNYETVAGLAVHSGSEGSDALLGLDDAGSWIFGAGGDDILSGNDYGDTLDGGAGTDLLSGGAGNDRYLFKLGGGHDTITDLSGNDRIVFGAGISAGQVSASQVGIDEYLDSLTNGQDGDGLVFGQVTLTVAPGDTISFSPADSGYGIEQFEFADGSVLGAGWITALFNAAPDGRDKTLTLNEDSAITLQAADFGFSGAHTGDTLSAVRIDSLPGAGSLRLNGVAVTAAQVVSAADLAAGRLVFSPAANANGSQYASLAFSVKDQNGVFDTTPNTLGFNVTPVNDAPALTGAKAVLANGAEDTAYSITRASLLAGFSDLESGSLSVLNLGASNGTLSALNAGSWTFTPNANYNGVVKLSYGVSDGAATTPATQSFTITPVNDSPVGTVTVSGNPIQNQVLRAAHTLTDVDGLGTVNYQWLAGGAAIAGATGATLTLAQAQVGKTISVRASYTDAKGTTESVASAATAMVANVNDAPTGMVTVSGTARQNQVLSAAHTLADADGLGSVNYQWLAGGAAIAGATGATLTLGQAQVGKAISVRASYTDGLGAAESVLSAASAPVVNVNDAPTGVVAITGTARQNQVLSAAHTLADVDGLGTVNYQWLAGGVAIAGATGATLTLGQAQVGKAISVGASYTDGFGKAESVASAATAVVANVNDAPTGSLSLLRSGVAVTAATTVQQGHVLSVASTLADPDGLGSLKYQWQSSLNGAGWRDVAGATAASFTLTPALAGQSVRVGVSYTDGGGTLESAASAATAAVNRMAGSAGADALAGTVGVDRLEGLAGNDAYTVNDAGDVVVENTNEGTDSVASSVSYSLAANVENLTLAGTAAINGTGNALNNALTGNSAANVLDGGAGADTMAGGAGNDVYVLDNAADVVIEAANAGTDTVQASVSYTLAANVENLTLTGSAVLNGTGNALANVLSGNAGKNILAGGAGGDSYLAYRGMGQDRIVENDPTPGITDVLSFGAGVSSKQLWFRHTGNDLDISIIGTADKATVQNWYSGSACHVEQIKAGDGKVLLDTQVEALVQAMAGLAPPAMGQIDLSAAYAAQLAPVLAANWH